MAQPRVCPPTRQPNEGSIAPTPAECQGDVRREAAKRNGAHWTAVHHLGNPVIPLRHHFALVLTACATTPSHSPVHRTAHSCDHVGPDSLLLSPSVANSARHLTITQLKPWCGFCLSALWFPPCSTCRVAAISITEIHSAQRFTHPLSKAHPLLPGLPSDRVLYQERGGGLRFCREPEPEMNWTPQPEPNPEGCRSGG